MGLKRYQIQADSNAQAVKKGFIMTTRYIVMSIDRPSEELMNKLYDVKVVKISVGTELTIAYMVEGDSLYRFVSHLQLMDDMNYMLIRHGFEF
jgi:hypothetical protein